MMSPAAVRFSASTAAVSGPRTVVVRGHREEVSLSLSTTFSTSPIRDAKLP
jgi:hypothetical protein